MGDGISNLQQKIDQFEKLLEEMREERRLAHEALKDIHKAQREIQTMLTADVKQMVEDRVNVVVKTELDEIGPTIRKQTNLIYERVGEQIDKLINLSLGNEFSTRRGKEDLRPALAAKLRIAIEEILEGEGDTITMFQDNTPIVVRRTKDTRS